MKDIKQMSNQQLIMLALYRLLDKICNGPGEASILTNELKNRAIFGQSQQDCEFCKPCRLNKMFNYCFECGKRLN